MRAKQTMSLGITIKNNDGGVERRIHDKTALHSLAPWLDESCLDDGDAPLECERQGLSRTGISVSAWIVHAHREAAVINLDDNALEKVVAQGSLVDPPHLRTKVRVFL